MRGSQMPIFIWCLLFIYNQLKQKNEKAPSRLRTPVDLLISKKRRRTSHPDHTRAPLEVREHARGVSGNPGFS
jgi:hypothetical protein